jgi:hypothetical protein
MLVIEDKKPKDRQNLLSLVAFFSSCAFSFCIAQCKPKLVMGGDKRYSARLVGPG